MPRDEYGNWYDDPEEIDYSQRPDLAPPDSVWNGDNGSGDPGHVGGWNTTPTSQQPETPAPNGGNNGGNNNSPGPTHTAEEADWLRRNPGDEHRMKAALSSGGGGGGKSADAGRAVVQSWSGGGGGGAQPAASVGGGYDALAREMFERQKTQEAARAAKEAEVEAARKAKADALYGDLSGRAKQSLAVDRNDPIIRAQSDAYAANETRASRGFLADLAEKAGPTANLLGEQRLASERIGQRTGALEAELIGKELSSRRDEIAQALSGMAGLLSADQVAGLQRELASLDAAMKQQGMALEGRGQDINYGLGSRGLDVQSQLGNRGMDIDWQRALMQNDQFTKRLGFDYWDRDNFWQRD